MAAHISRSLFSSASASSLTPFLYQTRTLTSLSRASYRPSTRELRHPYSTENNASDKHDGLKSSTSAGSGGLSPETSIEGTTSNPADKNAHAPRRSFLRRRADSIALSKAKNKKPSSPSKPLQTMTQHEKLIFADLLGQLDIKKGGQNAQASEKAGGQAQNPPSGKGKPENINELITMFDSILNDAQNKGKPVSKTKAESQKEPESGVTGPSSDIPGGSDKIRLRDLGFSEPASSSGEEIMITVKEAVEIVVRREAEKIEFELFRAIEEGKGDMRLWEVCKERIFSMLQHLDELASTTEALPGTATDLPDTNAAAEPTASTSSPGPLNIPDLVPTSPVVARLYPKTLLIAFRLLNTHFPDSQLISQFRSTIKAQGRTSAVLGTSEALYDEMIYFYWHGCNDLPAVVSFLHDMDLHGLNPSFKSRRLLKDIVRQRYRDLQAARETGRAEDPFWDLPPNRKAFRELAAPGGWLDQLEAFATERRRAPLFTRA